MSIRRWIAAVTVITGFALMASSGTAHHSSTPFYDPDNRIEIEGTVTRFVFRNPHAFLYLDVTDANGEVSEWQIELGAPVSIRRTGWTPDTLPIGMIVKASGRRSRAEGSQGLCCVRMTKADGSPVLEGGRVEERTQPPR
ncbi:MAG: hypothetical protein COA96_03500 [SAR86 cluster bacterium]|uniref:Uncharacterized protein n=1 Tax=SAR86 cluster bacterium TaxID=2030880 RepID=A0A2A5B7G3_9GAMM|nr:MAG: hypothetical protein COA96_03500 [SAR86 cluster bacterium]